MLNDIFDFLFFKHLEHWTGIVACVSLLSSIFFNLLEKNELKKIERYSHNQGIENKTIFSFWSDTLRDFLLRWNIPLREKDRNEPEQMIFKKATRACSFVVFSGIFLISFVLFSLISMIVFFATIENEELQYALDNTKEERLEIIDIELGDQHDNHRHFTIEFLNDEGEREYKEITTEHNIKKSDTHNYINFKDLEDMRYNNDGWYEVVLYLTPETNVLKN